MSNEIQLLNQTDLTTTLSAVVNTMSKRSLVPMR